MNLTSVDVGPHAFTVGSANFARKYEKAWCHQRRDPVISTRAERSLTTSPAKRDKLPRNEIRPVGARHLCDGVRLSLSRRETCVWLTASTDPGGIRMTEQRPVTRVFPAAKVLL